ncbi:MAG: putative metal-binding motif-containing protein [Planctomycetota bacterium]
MNTTKKRNRPLYFGLVVVLQLVGLLFPLASLADAQEIIVQPVRLATLVEAVELEPILVDMPVNTSTVAPAPDANPSMMNVASCTNVIYNNITTGGYIGDPAAGEEWLDWGTSSGGTVCKFRISYYTTAASPGTVKICFYSGTNQSNCPGSNIACYNISGLPGNGMYEVDIDLSGGSEFNLPPGNFGYSYEFDNNNTDMVIASGGSGNQDMFWADCTLSWFGGSPWAGFYMKITTEEDSPPDIDINPTSLNIDCTSSPTPIAAIEIEPTDLIGGRPSEKILIDGTGASGANPPTPATAGGNAVNLPPLINDAWKQPPVNMEHYYQNLRNIGLDPTRPDLQGLIARAGPDGAFTGTTESMTGTVTVAVMFVESNGSIDSNTYTWTTAHEDAIINGITSGLNWWTTMAAQHGCTLSFNVIPYRHTDSRVQQGYEPVTRSSDDAPLWVSAIMGNFGHTSGDHIARTGAFNTALRASQGTDWAYTAFICYNPPPAPSEYTDGYAAWAYMGGPYTNLLYRSFGWPMNQVFTHETGHIFWACDEYYQAGYGGCTDCGLCSSGSHGTDNGNCEFCNPNSVPCMMKLNTFNLCTYTPGQLGWGSCTGSSDCFTINNVGGQTLNVTSVTGVPSWLTLAPLPPYNIPGSGSQQVCLLVDCAAACAAPNPDATLAVNSNDPDEPSVNVSVHVDLTLTSWYRDADNDNYGDPNDSTQACSQPQGYVSDNTDCNDGCATCHPNAPEICDGLDNDCDGQTDEDFDVGDQCTVGIGECEASGNMVCTADETGTECDATPGQPSTEVCDNLDNDCDGQTDEDLTRPTTCGVGECAGNTGDETCTAGAWGGDTCDPYQGALPEICNGIDDDCDGLTDDDDPDCTGKLTWYGDTDSDTFGDPNNTYQACLQPAGYVSDNTDCNDFCSTCFPGANEVYDSLDNDCDGLTDEACDPPVLLSAESVMTHGGTLTCPIQLVTDPALANIEPRQDPSVGTPGPVNIEILFDRNIQPMDGSLNPNDEVTLSSGTITVLTITGPNLTIDMHGANNNDCLNVTLHGIASAYDGSCVVLDPDSVMPDTNLYIKVVLGECSDPPFANSSALVNIFDLGAVKSQISEPVTISNFYKDVKCDGDIGLFDLGLVKSNLFKQLSGINCP